MIQNGIIEIKTEQIELEKLLQKREKIIDFIWKGNGLPKHFPDSVKYDVYDKNFDDLRNLKKIDEITVEMKHDVNSIIYLLHPNDLQHNDLIIYHNGHGDYLYDGKKTVRFFLDRGYPVLTFSMPLNGMNSMPIMMIDGIETKFVSHKQFKLLESDEFSPISYFLEPIAVSLNFIDENFDYANYHMVGLSGGGWTAVIYPAIDQRISHTYSIAGSIPLEDRIQSRDKGDYEQRLPELYQIANYYDFYVLASFGENKGLTKFFYSHDECCFAGNEHVDTIKKIIDKTTNALTILEDGEFSVYNIPGDAHVVSGLVLKEILYKLDRNNSEYYTNMDTRLQNKDFMDLGVENYDFTFETFIDSDFTAATIVNSDFSNSVIKDSSFLSGLMKDNDFTNTEIRNTDFSYSRICDSKLENNIMHNVDFIDSVIIFNDFTKSNIKNINVSKILCYHCVFDDVDISKIKINENLNQPTRFAASSFKNVDFRNWEYYGTIDFSAKSVDITFPEAHVIRCFGQFNIGDRILITGIDLTGANFSGMDLKNFIFARDANDKPTLTNTDFSFADLSHQNLTNAIFVNANLSNSDLTGANLTNADLRDANLTGANLTDAILNCHNHEVCN